MKKYDLVKSLTEKISRMGLKRKLRRGTAGFLCSVMALSTALSMTATESDAAATASNAKYSIASSSNADKKSDGGILSDIDDFFDDVISDAKDFFGFEDEIPDFATNEFLAWWFETATDEEKEEWYQSITEYEEEIATDSDADTDTEYPEYGSDDFFDWLYSDAYKGVETYEIDGEELDKEVFDHDLIYEWLKNRPKDEALSFINECMYQEYAFYLLINDASASDAKKITTLDTAYDISECVTSAILYLDNDGKWVSLSSGATVKNNGKVKLQVKYETAKLSNKITVKSGDTLKINLSGKYDASQMLFTGGYIKNNSGSVIGEFEIGTDQIITLTFYDSFLGENGQSSISGTIELTGNLTLNAPSGGSESGYLNFNGVNYPITIVSGAVADIKFEQYLESVTTQNEGANKTTKTSVTDYDEVVSVQGNHIFYAEPDNTANVDGLSFLVYWNGQTDDAGYLTNAGHMKFDSSAFKVDYTEYDNSEVPSDDKISYHFTTFEIDSNGYIRELKGSSATGHYYKSIDDLRADNFVTSNPGFNTSKKATMTDVFKFYLDSALKPDRKVKVTSSATVPYLNMSYPGRFVENQYLSSLMTSGTSYKTIGNLQSVSQYAICQPAVVSCTNTSLPVKLTESGNNQYNNFLSDKIWTYVGCYNGEDGKEHVRHEINNDNQVKMDGLNYVILAGAGKKISSDITVKRYKNSEEKEPYKTETISKSSLGGYTANGSQYYKYYIMSLTGYDYIVLDYTVEDDEYILALGDTTLKNYGLYDSKNYSAGTTILSSFISTSTAPNNAATTDVTGTFYQRYMKLLNTFQQGAYDMDAIGNITPVVSIAHTDFDVKANTVTYEGNYHKEQGRQHVALTKGDGLYLSPAATGGGTLNGIKTLTITDQNGSVLTEGTDYIRAEIAGNTGIILLKEDESVTDMNVDLVLDYQYGDLINAENNVVIKTQIGNATANTGLNYSDTSSWSASDFIFDVWKNDEFQYGGARFIERASSESGVNDGTNYVKFSVRHANANIDNTSAVKLVFELPEEFGLTKTYEYGNYKYTYDLIANTVEQMNNSGIKTADQTELINWEVSEDGKTVSIELTNNDYNYIELFLSQVNKLDVEGEMNATLYVKNDLTDGEYQYYAYCPVDLSVSEKYLKKEGVYDETTAPLANFTLTVNEGATAFDGQLMVYDELSDTMSLKTDTIKVYRAAYDKSGKETTPTELGTEEYTVYVYSDNQVTFTLPDKAKLYITYSAYVNGSVGSDANIENTAGLMVSGNIITEDIIKNSVVVMEAGSTAVAPNINVHKTDQYNNPLSGVPFILYTCYRDGDTYKYTGTSEQKTGTTDANGNLSFSDLKNDTVYALVENWTDSGSYDADFTEYFVIPSKDSTAAYPSDVKEVQFGYTFSVINQNAGTKSVYFAKYWYTTDASKIPNDGAAFEIYKNDNLIDTITIKATSEEDKAQVMVYPNVYTFNVGDKIGIRELNEPTGWSLVGYNANGNSPGEESLPLIDGATDALTKEEIEKELDSIIDKSGLDYKSGIYSYTVTGDEGNEIILFAANIDNDFYKPEKATYTVEKYWYCLEEEIPESVEIEVYKNGTKIDTVTLTKENADEDNPFDWISDKTYECKIGDTFGIKEVNPSENFNLHYKFYGPRAMSLDDEAAVADLDSEIEPAAYMGEGEIDENGVFTILTSSENIGESASMAAINISKSNYLSAFKIWKDEDNSKGIRTESVKVDIIEFDWNAGMDVNDLDVDKDGTVIKTVTLSDDNYWQDGVIAKKNKCYTIRESVPAGYTASYSCDTKIYNIATGNKKEATNENGVIVNKAGIPFIIPTAESDSFCVIITNSLKEGLDAPLPSTGASGILPFFFSGAALMAAAKGRKDEEDTETEENKEER